MDGFVHEIKPWMIVEVALLLSCTHRSENVPSCAQCTCRPLLPSLVPVGLPTGRDGRVDPKRPVPLQQPILRLLSRRPLVVLHADRLLRVRSDTKTMSERWLVGSATAPSDLKRTHVGVKCGGVVTHPIVPDRDVPSTPFPLDCRI